MATVALGVVGAGIGSVFGGPLGARIGWATGTLLGGMLDYHGQEQTRGRLEDLRVTGSGYGSIIPQCWGLARFGGNVIWSTPLVETSTKGPGSGKLGPSVKVYHYSVQMAVAVCRGPVTRIRRIWGEDVLLYDYTNPVDNAPVSGLSLYLGTETQLADALVASKQQSGQAPAFRGLCYVVFDTLMLDLWGGRIPSMTFEVESNEGYQRLVINQSGLQAFYQFENEPVVRLGDSGPHQWHLADAGGLSNQIAGRQGAFAYQAANGVTSNRTIGNQTVLQGPLVSVEGWFQWQGTFTGDSQFQYKNPNTGEIAWRLWVGYNGFTQQTTIRFRVFTNASGVTDLFTYTQAVDNNWHHIAVTYDTAGSAILYVDGVAVSTVTAPVTSLVITSDAANKIQIVGGDYAMDGLAVYNTLLATNDITDRWKGGAVAATVSDVLTDVFTQCGLASTQWDMAGAYTPLHGGYMATQRQEGRGTFDSLLSINFIDLAEWDGRIRAVARGGSPVVTVPLNDLGTSVWSPSGQPSGETRIQTKRIQDWDMPRRVDLTYYTAVPALIDDVYTVNLGSPTGGTFTLSINGDSTVLQNYNISTTSLQNNLNGLTAGGVGSGNVVVTGSTPTWTVTFQGIFSGTPVNFQGTSQLVNGNFQIIQQNVSNYSQAVQSATRFTKTWTSSLLTINTPAILDDGTARQMAERLLYDHWLQREQMTFNLPPAYWVYTPSDVVNLPVAGNTVRARLLTQDVGLFGPTAFTASQDSPTILTQSVAGANVTYNNPTTVSTNTTLIAFSPNALADADTTSSGFYYSMAGAVAGESWPGAALYWSQDGGTNYLLLGTGNDPAIFGTCSTTLPAPSAAVADLVWDTVSTVNVTMTNGVPLSDSLTNVLNGTNLAMVGGELIQYATVTPLGGGSYQLSQLLRGRRGTDTFMATHGASETFILVSSGGVARQNLDQSLRGKTVMLKAVTAGQQLAAVSPTSLLITGNEFKCYTPAQVAGTRDGSNNLTITWVRRTRSGGELQDAHDVADPDAPDSYDVDVLASPGGAVVRTFAALSAATVTYSAANQITDFGSVQNPVNLVVYQNGVFGRGYGEVAAV